MKSKKIRSLLLVLLLPLAAVAAPLVPGTQVPALVLEDQHGKTVSVGAGTKIVLFTADKAASDFANEVLGAQPAGVLERLGAVYFADISAMPALISRMFALPALRELPFQVGLGREPASLADLPRERGAVTLLRLQDGKVLALEFARDAGQLRQALGLR